MMSRYVFHRVQRDVGFKTQLGDLIIDREFIAYVPHGAGIMGPGIHLVDKAVRKKESEYEELEFSDVQSLCAAAEGSLFFACEEVERPSVNMIGILKFKSESVRKVVFKTTIWNKKKVRQALKENGYT